MSTLWQNMVSRTVIQSFEAALLFEFAFQVGQGLDLHEIGRVEHFANKV